MIYQWIKASVVRSFLALGVMVQLAVVLIATACAAGSPHHDSHTVLLAWLIVLGVEMCISVFVTFVAACVHHLD